MCDDRPMFPRESPRGRTERGTRELARTATRRTTFLLLLVLVSPTFLLPLGAPSIWRAFFGDASSDLTAHEREVAASVVADVSSGRVPDDSAMGDALAHFTSNELRHLADVTRLVQAMMMLTVLATVAGILLWRLDPVVRRGSETFLREIRTSASWVLGVVGFLTLAVVATPATSLSSFHRLFFPQGNFSFGSQTTLIRSFPPTYFVWLGALVGFGVAAVNLVALILSRRGLRGIEGDDADSRPANNVRRSRLPVS